MKKFLSILLSLTLLLSVVALPIGAVDAAAMYTETSAGEVSAGDTFTYTISLSGSYMGYACSIPVIDGLTVETITKSDTDLGKATNVDKKADGSYLLSVLPSFDTTDAEKSLIATVTVKVNDDAPVGTITLSLDKVQVANSVGDKVADLQTHFASISVVEKAHEHSYGAWSKLDGEYHHRTCACGDEQKEAHKWDDGEVTTPATHTEKGVKIFKCTVCEATKTEDIPTLTEHSYGAWTKLDDEFHHRTCVCGDEQKEAHKWDDGIVTTPATDTTPGVKTYTCTVCNATKTEEIPVVSEKSGSLSTVKSSPGKTVVVEFSLNNSMTVQAFSIQDITYDTSVMTLDVANIIIPSNINPFMMDISENGDVIMGFSDMTDLSGVILEIPFIISADAENGDYTVTCKALYDDGDGAIEIPVEAGTVTLQKYKPGDVNGDDKVTSADAIQLMWSIFKPKDYSVTDQSHDYNKDGKVTSADAIYLMWSVFKPKDYPLG